MTNRPIMTLPEQLKNPDFRFVLLGKWNHWRDTESGQVYQFSEGEPLPDKKRYNPLGKAPFEKAWQKNGYKFDSPKLLNHTNNFGIIGGYGGLRILDVDDRSLIDEISEKIGKTFVVKTGSGGRHFYFFSDYEENHVLAGGKGELRSKNYQVVCPECRHPSGNFYKVIDNSPIKKLTHNEVAQLLAPYIKKTESTDYTNDSSVDRSALEFKKAAQLFATGSTREEVHEVLQKYPKYRARNDVYRTNTLNAAELAVLNSRPKITDSSHDVAPRDLKPSRTIYDKVYKIFAKYVDASPKVMHLLSIWTIGSHAHSKFSAYPILAIDGLRGSGKSRTQKIICRLGAGHNTPLIQPTVAGLFRHPGGVLALDELEQINSRETSGMRQVLNSLYKSGATVSRLTETKKDGKKTFESEYFDLYFPTTISNIAGIGHVLRDRCLTVTLFKSVGRQSLLIEDFNSPNFEKIQKKLSKIDIEIPENTFSSWNTFISSGDAPHNFKNLFSKIKKTGFSGRFLELCLPLLITAEQFGVVDDILTVCEDAYRARQVESVDQVDQIVIGYVTQNAQRLCGNYIPLKELHADFIDFWVDSEEWFTPRYFCKILGQTGFLSSKRLSGGCTQVLLVIPPRYKNMSTLTTLSSSSSPSTRSTKNKSEHSKTGKKTQKTTMTRYLNGGGKAL